VDPTLEHDAFPAEPRRLSTFIREHQAEILAQWAASVRELPRADGLEQPALVDHIPGFLARIAELADEYVAGGKPLLPSEIADLHALERLSEGFELDEVVRELAILRDCIVRMWSEQARMTRSDALGIRALDQAIDRAIGASIQRYTAARDRTLQSLDRISAAALETRSLDAFLERLLRVLLETTAAVDTATIVLRDGDLLRTRASAGLEAEVACGCAVRIGEGFVEMVAATQRPQFIENVAADRTVLSPSLRASGVNALYGVPLVEAGEVIGVAHMGSRIANSFSTQDRHLFLAMATRATAGIVQHQLRDAADRRADQQHAVATIGMRALAATDLPALFAEAVEVVAFALRVEHAAVLELQADHRLAVKTEAGWGVQSSGLEEPASLESYAGFTVLAGAPALVNDLDSDTRFRFPPVFRERGVTSCVGVAIPIPGAHADNYGDPGSRVRLRGRQVPPGARTHTRNRGGLATVGAGSRAAGTRARASAREARARPGRSRARAGGAR
jgi:putative methionine-R-sulfoxide reductase with GAF domain